MPHICLNTFLAQIFGVIRQKVQASDTFHVAIIDALEKINDLKYYLF